MYNKISLRNILIEHAKSYKVYGSCTHCVFTLVGDLSGRIGYVSLKRKINCMTS